jgi:hypothetical protein
MDFGTVVRQAMSRQLRARPDSPVAKAPSVLRDTLLFRYIEGSSFVQKFLKKHGSWKKLDLLFDNPPLSSEQIMHPEKYMDRDKVDYPVKVIMPKLHEKLEGEWEEVATNTMGEYQTRLLLSEYIDVPEAKKPSAEGPSEEPSIPRPADKARKRTNKAAAAAAGWDGDRYTMIESTEKGGPQIIVWLSVWDTMQDAQEFVKAYAELLSRRFKKELTLVGTGYFMETGEGSDTALVEFSGTQALVIQGAPASLVPKIREEALKARQVIMKEGDFSKLAGHKLKLPTVKKTEPVDKPEEKPEQEPAEEPEEKPEKKEPDSRDF